MTYKIIGADGREYGPVSLEELQDWSRQGRVAAGTQILRSDESNWKPAAQYPELGLATQAAAPPVLEVSERGLQPVGFWPRAGAWLIDSMLIGIVIVMIGGRPRTDTLDLVLMVKNMFYEMVLTVVYYVGMNGSIGATVGKMVIGARIVFMDGSKIGYGRALLRWLASLLSGLLLGIGYLMVAFREDKRGLHDLLAGTQVVYRR